MIFENWYELDEPRESPWQRIVRIATTPPLSDYMMARVMEMLARWMLRLTNSVVVWELTKSNTMVGWAVIAMLVPGMIAEPMGGVLADRYDRRALLGAANVAVGLTALTLALLTWSGALTVPLLFLLIIAQGAALAFGHSPGKTLVVSLVPKNEIPTAISLNAVLYNVAGFVGPAIAGVLIWKYGASGAYFAATAMCVVFALLLIRVPAAPVHAGEGHHHGVIAQLQAGCAYVVQAPLIGYLLILHLIAAALGRPFVDFVAAMVEQLFNGGSREAATVISALGIGSICGGLWLAGRDSRAGLVDVALNAMPLLGLAMIAFAWSPSYWLAVGLAFIIGIYLIIRASATQSLLQIETSPGYRGRVMALHGVMLDIGAFAGALLIGTVADYAGVQTAWTIGVGIAVAAWFWLKDRLRRAMQSHRSGD